LPFKPAFLCGFPAYEAELMTDRPGRWTWLTAALLAAVAAACGEEPQLATEHIRATLGGAEPAAMAEPGAVNLEDAADEEVAGAESSGVTSSGSTAASDGASGTDSPAGAPVLVLPGGDTVQVRERVVEFYRERGYEPAWTGYDDLEPDGVVLLGAIGELSRDGLDPNAYHHGSARELARVLAAGEAGERKLEHLGDLDILLTEAFVRAALDLERGLLDPEAAGLSWRIERAEPTDSAVMARLAAGEDPRRIISSLRPRVPYYHRLAEGLRTLRAVEAEGGWPSVSEGETLGVGDRDARVAQLRARLLAGDDREERRLAARGQGDPQLFDESLKQALRRFQVRHTLHEDGALGPNSLAALNVPVSERIETVRLNLDRWRWLPPALGEEYLLVNVAGFELELVAGDSVLESMNVVVGRTANRTPLFRDSLQYVVVNPYWNVPMSIARQEIIPAVWRDRGYLARNGYEVLHNGRVIDSSWISAPDLDSGRYQIRQRPGPRNALGAVKFMFPNDMNIYLHDTPADHLFSQEARAFSYGCIRVERPADLARTLLDRYTDGDGSDYDRLRSESGERWVTLDRKIPIYILYFTAWAKEDGTLRFHPDIYERDAALAGQREAKLPPVRG
jgi:L,D-transpeptidase YcbB